MSPVICPCSSFLQNQDIIVWFTLTHINAFNSWNRVAKKTHVLCWCCQLQQVRFRDRWLRVVAYTQVKQSTNCLFYFRSRPWVNTFRFHLYTEPLTGAGVSPNNFPWSWVTRIAKSYPVSDPNQKYLYQEAFSKPRAFKNVIIFFSSFPSFVRPKRPETLQPFSRKN